MPVPLENWGQLKLSTTKPEVKSEGEADGNNGEAVVELLALAKGKAKDQATYVPQPILRIPVSAIASASGTTKNDVSLTMRPTTAAAGATNDLELTSIRFAVPNVCVGYDQTEEAGKAILQDIQNSMLQYQERFLQTHGSGTQDSKLLALAAMGSGQAKHADETIVAIFDDVLLSYPAGKYKMVISNYTVVLDDKKKGASAGVVSFPLSDIQNIFLCDVPVYFSATDAADFSNVPQYVVLILKAPLRIRTATYNHVVISCPAGLVLDDEHPWRCELKTQEEINKVLQLPVAKEGEEPALVPTMSGRVSDILTRTFKAIAKVPAYGGVNKEYRSVLTGRAQSSMRCIFHGAEGLLYIVNSGFLFLHRPTTRIAFADIVKVKMDESESGQSTFKLTVYANGAKGEDKYVFSSIAKEEEAGLLAYLRTRVKLEMPDEKKDEEEEEEEDDEEGGDEEGDDDDDEDSEDDDDDDGDDEDKDEDEDSESGSRKRRRAEKAAKSEKKEKKHKHDKKHKKDKKHHKKEKKHKSHRHEKKDE